MRTYKVEDNDRNVLGSYSSAEQAISAIEQYFQSGTEEGKAAIKSSLRGASIAVVHHNVFAEVTCIIEKS